MRSEERVIFPNTRCMAHRRGYWPVVLAPWLSLCCLTHNTNVTRTLLRHVSQPFTRFNDPAHTCTRAHGTRHAAVASLYHSMRIDPIVESLIANEKLLSRDIVKVERLAKLSNETQHRLLSGIIIFL